MHFQTLIELCVFCWAEKVFIFHVSQPQRRVFGRPVVYLIFEVLVHIFVGEEMLVYPIRDFTFLMLSLNLVTSFSRGVMVEPRYLNAFVKCTLEPYRRI